MGYRFFLSAVALLLALALAGAGNAAAQTAASKPGSVASAPRSTAPGGSPAAVANPVAPNPASANNDYHLGSGDKIRVSVFGQADLNGEYVVDGAGFVQLPLIGQVQAAGLTVQQFQKEVTSKFADGYLVNPNVDIEVTGYRPFYIIGEVKTPGQYAYVNGMSVLNAVALAGGFTDRADKSEVYIRPNGASKEIELPADETTKVNPGDIIRISERFF